MNRKAIDFFNQNRPATPCLVLDIEVVRDNYAAFRKHLPASDVFYAVKANPAPEILEQLAALGSNFDCASVAEIQMALDAGAAPDRISFGNTIKKERDISRAHSLGVSLFAVDCIDEARKVSQAAPGASAFCRILTDGDGAEWPLSRKFGCDQHMAIRVLTECASLGLRPLGVSFHVGSQMTDPHAWDAPIGEAKAIFDALSLFGIDLELLNLGGGFPTRYLKDVPSTEVLGEHIQASLRRHFGTRIPRTIIEPGRGMVGNAGSIFSEVVLTSRKSDGDDYRWVYLDIGKFGGLAETMDESIRYPFVTAQDGDELGDCVVAGPTCDSADVLYERTKYSLPLSLKCGDIVLIEGTGAYTTTYSAVAFNGFEPLRSYAIGTRT